MTSNKNPLKRNSIAPVSNPRSQSVQTFEQNGKMMQVPNIVIETVASDGDHDDIHLREYVRRVLRNKALVLIVTILSMILPAIYIFSLPKVYQAEAKIQVDSENPEKLSAMKANATTYDHRAYYNTQVQLLRNSRLIGSVIKDHDLENDQRFLDEDFIEPDLINRNNVFGNPDRQSGETDKSKKANTAAESERLIPYVEAIQRSLSVRPILQSKQVVKDTRLISLKFSHPDPRISKLVTNALADKLVELNLDNQTESNSREQKYLEDNINELKAQIQSGEKRILQYGRKYQLPTEDGNQNTVVERLVGLNRQLLEAENARKLAEAKYNASLAPGALEALSETGSQNIADIESKIDDLQQKRSRLLVEVTEKYPEVQEIDKQIAVLKNASLRTRTRTSSNYKKGLEVSYKQAVAREKAIRKSYNRQWEKTLNQNGAAINYRIIQQELETNRKLLDEMQRREKEGEMLTAKAPNNIRVIESALTPAEPIDRRRAELLVLAFLASFSLGIGSALVREYFKEPEALPENSNQQKGIPGMSPTPLIAEQTYEEPRNVSLVNPISVIKDIQKEQSRPAGNDGALVLNSDSQSILAEAFYQLQTLLKDSPGVRDTRNLLITSSDKSKGQTKTLVNIAKNLAETGASVLIIDADFRGSGMHEVFKCSNEYGLSNLLNGQSNRRRIDDFIIEVSENLHFLPSGRTPHNCSESLGSTQMRQLMASLDAEFDYIIIDSPPVLYFADSSVLATMVDGVLLAVDESSDSVDKVKQTRNFLTMAGANVVGVIWNKSDS
ncbi:MAG: polysaccharide biosynthesis tyrosine autokinase [Pyrinomonadaceae bacterium]|nr:polysaccharide biosynthesis tyrosine autokinase [Pyrinomonadaceae bacterium]